MKLDEFTELFGFSAAQFNSWKEGKGVKSNPEISKKLQFLTNVIKILPKEKVLKILERDNLNLNYKDIEDNFGIIYTKIYRWNKKREEELNKNKEEKKDSNNKKEKRNFNIEKKLKLIEFLQKLEPEEIECLKNILSDA